MTEPTTIVVPDGQQANEAGELFYAWGALAIEMQQQSSRDAAAARTFSCYVGTAVDPWGHASKAMQASAAVSHKTSRWAIEQMEQSR